MNEITLNADEKAVLRFLYDNPDGDIETFSELSAPRRSAASKSLRAKDLILAQIESGGNVVAAKITNTGMAYVDMNPDLNDPLSLQIERLQKENLILQNSGMEYKVKIRKQEDVIRLWKLISAIVGLVGFAGWVLFSFF